MSTPSPQPQHDTSIASPAQGSVPNSPPANVPLPGAAQTVLNFLGQAGTAREQLHSAREHMSHAREHLSDPSMPATILGAAQGVFSRLTAQDQQHHHHSPVASASGAHPLPEVSRDQPAELHASPVDAPAPARAAEPTVPPPTSVSSHGGAAITPPTRGSRAMRSSYPGLPEAAHSRPIPVPYGTAYRRSAGPYVDGETAWHARDEREPFRERTVGQRVEATIDSATVELAKASERARNTNMAQNIALALQVLIGALTTALGAALSGKNTSVAISILGGASTLIASYLARTKGSNEPQLSSNRAQLLEHFLREIKAFDLDHGHEIGPKWDDRINGFRLGLERILGNQPGSVAVNANGKNNTNQEKGMGGMDPNTGFGGLGNGSYPVGTMKAKSPLEV